jgi:hypothetical protein
MKNANDSYTVKELREVAKTYKIKNISKLNKVELCNEIIKCMDITACELPVVETSTYFINTDTGSIPVESECETSEQFANSGIFDNCVSVSRWDNGDVKSFCSERLWCELPEEVEYYQSPVGTTNQSRNFNQIVYNTPASEDCDYPELKIYGAGYTYAFGAFLSLHGKDDLNEKLFASYTVDEFNEYLHSVQFHFDCRGMELDIDFAENVGNFDGIQTHLVCSLPSDQLLPMPTTIDELDGVMAANNGMQAEYLGKTVVIKPVPFNSLYRVYVDGEKWEDIGCQELISCWRINCRKITRSMRGEVNNNIEFYYPDQVVNSISNKYPEIRREHERRYKLVNREALECLQIN